MWLWLFGGLLVSLIGGYKLLMWRIDKLEEDTYEEAPSVTWKPSDMIKAAQKKKDNDMNDEEFNIKYGVCRHEAFRNSLISTNIYRRMNNLFYWIELNLINGGEIKLAKNISIDRPIFIIGDYRSGTSVLERLIAHHPLSCHFTFIQAFCWKAPQIWNNFVGMARDYRNNYGRDDSHRAWYTAGDPGIFYPHSSNNALSQNAPLECEALWEDCIRNMQANRHMEWKDLDDIRKNPDNSTNEDLLDEHYSDPEFERLMKNVIRLQLAYHHKLRKFDKKKDTPSRFINKNPMNGFRVGYLYQMFPDAKFIHLSRNPLKTCESQLQLEDCAARCWYFDPKEFRENAMFPKPIPKSQYGDKPPKHWSWLLHGNYPNQFLGFHWFPRVFPRTTPEYYEITKYLKKDKRACAFATSIVQQENYALKAYERLGFKEGKNVLKLWHEDLLENPSTVLEKVFEFVEMDTTSEQIMTFLRKEDFPQGKANVTRVERSNETQQDIFGEETAEVLKILEPCFQRFKERKSSTRDKKISSSDK